MKMLKVSWKALVSFKSILKLIESIMALIAFILTATFDTETTLYCHTFHPGSERYYFVVSKTDFPFDYLDYNDGTNLSRIDFDRDYGAMAQSFLAWGVITLIYCIIAVIGYVMLNESQEWRHYEKTATIFYLADFGGSILWSVVWLVVNIVWMVGSIQMEDFIQDESICSWDDATIYRDDASFAQTYVSIGFGYALLILWTLSTWWALKSTFIYQSIVRGKSKGGYEQI